MDFGHMVVSVARDLGGPSHSRLIGFSDKVVAANAVLANGTLAHGLDYDDTLEEAIVHTGCCAAVTALAVGEEVKADGKRVLEATVAGIEVMCKVGLVAPGKFHARGFYPAFGGDGPFRLEKMLELGKIWETPRITFKSYPCGSISHPYMDCALRLKEKYSIRPGEIEEVICRTAEGPVHRLWEPLKEKQRPSSSYGAKFSLPYSIAVMLVRGRAGLEEFSDEAIQDPETLSLAAKVRYELDPTTDYPRHFSGHVMIKLKNGTTLEESQPHPRGGLESPLPPTEIETKVRSNARMALSHDKVERIIALVNSLEKLPSMKELSDLLAPIVKRG